MKTTLKRGLRPRAVPPLAPRSGLSRALKAHPDFIGNSPFEMTPPQRFTVEG